MPEFSPCCGRGLSSGDLSEDMPMVRYTNPIPTCGGRCGISVGSGGDYRTELEQILSTIAYQNQLLVDLLGAVNSLTATLLAERSS